MLGISGTRAAALFCAGMAFASIADSAPASRVMTHAVQYGQLALPYTTNLGQSLSPLASPYASTDYFVSDYGFSLATSASFSSAVVTFDLGQVLQLSDLSMRLLQGSTPWAGPLPAGLSALDIASRNDNALVRGSGNATAQAIDAIILPAGSYVLELSGRVTGSAGGSYGGVWNLGSVTAVPEPSGSLLALSGLLLLGLVRRRERH